MATRTTRGDQTQSDIELTKPKHRPSRTPTGLPGDEPKAHRHIKQQNKLGKVVDTLLVPEHKAARRLIRRSQKRNPKMSAGSNMTLYERIMAYRLLKEKGMVQGESKDDSSEDDTKKLERSDTGWGSVDISQYTNKKDPDDNRSPTPPPTLVPVVGSRQHKQIQDGDTLLTARDVHVDIQDNLKSKQPLPPVRSTTPKTKRTPTPTRDRILSRQTSDLNVHPVLPRIQDSRQGVVHTESRVRSAEEDRELDNTFMAAVGTVEVKDRSNVKYTDGVKKEEYIRNVVRNDVEEISDIKIHTEEIGDRAASGKSNVVKSFTEEKDRQVKVEEEDIQQRNKSREKEERVENQKYNEETHNYGNVREDTRSVVAAMASDTLQPSRERTSSSHQQNTNEPTSRTSNSRESPSESTRSPAEKPEKSRTIPKRKTPMADEIERLDKMVDRDLNEIIRKLGNKGSNMKEDDMEKQLKSKIFDPKFQSDMDKYLRDI